MFRTTFSFGALVFLTGAALLATPALGLAQRGGHGGGFHGGGFHGGGGSFGGYRGGISHGGYVGGYRGGVYHGGSYGGYHYGGYPYAHYGYDRYRSSYGGSGYYPYYSGLYGYSPYYDGYSPYAYGYSGGYYPDYGTTPYTGSDLTYDSGGTAYVPPSTSAYQSYYAPTPAATPAAAHVTVKVPADAQVWFDNTLTTSTGAVREYDSPPLTPGGRYSYQVRARWNDNGKEVTQTQRVEVSAGANVRVDFPVAATTAEQQTAAPKP